MLLIITCRNQVISFSHRLMSCAATEELSHEYNWSFENLAMVCPKIVNWMLKPSRLFLELSKLEDEITHTFIDSKKRHIVLRIGTKIRDMFQARASRKTWSAAQKAC
jgi:hypothetical protein